jgi:hypothetical protein
METGTILPKTIVRREVVFVVRGNQRVPFSLRGIVSLARDSRSYEVGPKRS